mgnify:CR=1 FL=1
MRSLKNDPQFSTAHGALCVQSKQLKEEDQFLSPLKYGGCLFWHA